MTIVEINHLQVTFAEKTAVSAASFSVNAGETFSLIGESGCGKSTILRVIAGLQRDWHGQVSLFGHTIKPGMRFQGDLRRNVQMVFQDPYASLHPNHTLWRTLAEPLKIRGEREIEKRVQTALEQVGLPFDAARRYPHQLSGGQRQRVVIARALLLRPQLLLLDEPTSALDMSVQAEILNLLKAADSGDADACALLAQIKITNPVSLDYPQAKVLAEKAAQAGSKEGEVTLAHILVNTQAGKPDYPKAISLLENASEDLENDSAVDAQMLLGLIYANGVGIKADDDKATWYFKRSSAISRTGYSEYWAGMMFLNGEEGFIEKNKQKALHWLNLSCMEGFDTGCEEFEKLTNG
ncbi:ATP-binding cassette domain-containing protein [Escherichia coli]